MDKRFVTEDGIRANYNESSNKPARVIILLGGSNGGHSTE
jgi:hypothetical protein